MDLKTSVSAAINCITEVFEDQGISNVLLEEIERDEDSGGFSVTIGFDRKTSPAAVGALGGIAGLIGRGRAYKVVKFDSLGEVVSIKDRLIK